MGEFDVKVESGDEIGGGVENGDEIVARLRTGVRLVEMSRTNAKNCGSGERLVRTLSY